MKRHHVLGYLLCIVLLFAFVSTSFSEILFIANKNVADEAFAKTDIKNIFLGKKAKWKDRSDIQVAILKDDNEIHNLFLKTYIKKTRSQFRWYWRTILFSGKGLLPKIFQTTEEMIDYVAQTDGAIGYIDDKTNYDNVKILKIK